MPTTCPKCGGTGKLLTAEELRARRIARGFQLVQMAKKMGISPSYYSDLEQGRRDLNLELMTKFEKAIK